MMIVSVAEEMNPLRRSTMEDSHEIGKEGTWGCKNPDLRALAVFDGHGGKISLTRDEQGSNRTERNRTERFRRLWPLGFGGCFGHDGLFDGSHGIHAGFLVHNETNIVLSTKHSQPGS